MLKRVSVADVQNGRLTREDTYLAIVMRFYPRFLKRELVDEYDRRLAPPAELFTEFKAQDRKLANHNSAFYLVNYEERFNLTPDGRARLAQLAELSRTRTVALVCQCSDFDRCHCDLLLLWTRHAHKIETGKIIFDYPIFQARLESGSLD